MGRWAELHKASTAFTVLGLVLGVPGTLVALQQLGVIEPSPTATEVRDVSLFTLEGLSPAYFVEKKVDGECIGTAITSGDPDALRCFGGDGEVLDPCWANGDRNLVACPDDPWEDDVVVLQPVVVPERGHVSDQSAGSSHWAFEIQFNGQAFRCVLMSSYAGEISYGGDTYERRYSCAGPGGGGWLYRPIDTSRDLWRVYFGRRDSDELVQAVVVTAWR